MHLFKLLVGEFHGILGKPYLLAGLLPAGLLILGWDWYFADQSLLLMARSFEQESVEIAPRLIQVSVAVLGFSLLFFAVRTLLYSALVDLPGPLGPLRWLLQRRMDARQRAQERRRLELDDAYTAIRWTRDGNGVAFEQPGYRPPHVKVPGTRTVLSRAADARAILAAAEVDGVLPSSRRTLQVWWWWRTHRRVLRGLTSLHAYAQDPANPLAYRDVIDRWKALVQQAPVAQALKGLENEVLRELSVVVPAVANAPPAIRRWPTSLGLQAAILDEYGRKRYAIETATLFTRLWVILKEDERQSVAESKLSVEVMINLAVALLLLALAVVWDGGRLLWDLGFAQTRFDPRAGLTLLISLGLAYAFYRSAVFAHTFLAECITRLVDLNRLALLKHLGFEPPATVAEERRLWSDLAGFYEVGRKLDDDLPIRAPE